MRRKTTHQEAEGLSQDDLCDHRPTPAYAALEVGTRVALGNWLEPNRGARRGAAAPSMPSETTSGTRSPRTDYPGIFLNPRGDLTVVTTVEEFSRREELLSRKGTAQYHDSELGDVYDLYNACNGVMSGGLLDVRKLDELTWQERQVFDIERLHEVWEHTASGCTTCAQIIRTLNLARGRLRGSAIYAAEHAQDKERDTNDD